jgi:hypothetical protein
MGLQAQTELDDAPGQKSAGCGEIVMTIVGPNDPVVQSRYTTEPMAIMSPFFGVALFACLAAAGDNASKAAEAPEDYGHYLHGVNPLGVVYLYLTNMKKVGAEHSACAARTGIHPCTSPSKSPTWTTTAAGPWARGPSPSPAPATRPSTCWLFRQ